MNTVFYALAVLALGQAVVSHSSSVSSVPVQDQSSSLAVSASTHPSSSVHTEPSSTVPAVSSASQSIPSSSNIPSAPATISSQAAPVATSVIKTSFASSESVSPTATPLLSSAVLKTSVPVAHSSSVPGPIMTTASAMQFSSASPTASPIVENIHFNDTTNKSVPCFAAKLKVVFTVTYSATGPKNGTEISKATIPLDGPLRNPSGNCSFDTGMAYFSIKWNEEGKRKPLHTFAMRFKLNNKTKEWSITEIMANFDTSDTYVFKNSSEGRSFILATYTGKVFGGSHKSNYLCNSKTTLKLTEDVSATFSDVNFQPFSKKSELDKSGKHCPADDDDDDDDNTVPIAVGAALGGLVLIVLVAYIIGRRRSNRGYEQV